ncbi:MAG TPA: hypothetical protein VIJ61_15510 [Thermoanaerobaculia bacterium]
MSRNNYRRNHSSVLSTARAVLEKSPHYKRYALEDAAKALDDTYSNVALKVRFYKWTALALLTLIPILSAVLSLLLSPGKTSIPVGPYAVYVSYVLTLLTILSSIFNPGERFKRICMIGVALGDIKTWTLEQLEDLPRSEDSAHKLAMDLRDKLRPYEIQLIELFLPETKVPPEEKSAKGDNSQAQSKGQASETGTSTKAA